MVPDGAALESSLALSSNVPSNPKSQSGYGASAGGASGRDRRVVTFTIAGRRAKAPPTFQALQNPQPRKALLRSHWSSCNELLLVVTFPQQLPRCCAVTVVPASVVFLIGSVLSTSA